MVRGGSLSYSFGKRPARSLESFGVAGLLGEECRVFYNSLYGARHIGRVTDLLAARLKKAHPDEARLRAMVLFSAIEAYIEQAGEEGLNSDRPLTEPMVVECGVDGEKVAIGVAFTVPENVELKPDGVAKRMTRPVSGFDKMIKALQDCSHRVVVRYQSSVRRIEIVALLGLPGKMDAAYTVEGAAVTFVAVDEAEETPKAASYVELGDLDYNQLLKEDNPGAKVKTASTGELLVKSTADPIAAMESIRVKGAKDEADKATTVIKGGASGDLVDNSTIVIKGGDEETGGLTSAQSQHYLDKISELNKKIEALQAEQGSKKFKVKGGSSEDEDEDDEDDDAKPKLGGLFKKVWPFKKTEDDSEGDVENSEVEGKPEEKSEEKKAEQPEEKVASPAEAAASVEDSATTSAANNLLVEIQAGSLDRMVDNAQREMNDLKKELGSGKAKRWADGLMTELVQERSKLQDMAKKLNLSVRQKELEFRNKEQSLLEELRRRDEMLRQKNTALNRTKEQLAQASMAMDRLKTANASAADDLHYRQKYQQSHKILMATRDENKNLQEKVEDLQQKLGSAQMASKRAGAGSAELSALQTKVDRAQRLADEFKRTNQLLMERLEAQDKLKPSASAGSTEELKKRLDAAVKLANSARSENERMVLQVEELQREEARLKGELEKMSEELKKKKAA